MARKKRRICGSSSIRSTSGSYSVMTRFRVFGREERSSGSGLALEHRSASIER
jgi:hypothetical protein